MLMLNMQRCAIGVDAEIVEDGTDEAITSSKISHASCGRSPFPSSFFTNSLLGTLPLSVKCFM